MKRVMVQLTEEQIAALKRLAKEREASVARLVREAVSQYVVQAEKTAEMEKRRQRALEFLDYIKEHPEEFSDIEEKSDVSANHDAYFVQTVEDGLR